MEFFDKLTKKASETYKATKEKTSKLSEEFKLKNLISDKKEQIEELYREIGKLVAEDLKSGKDSDKETVSKKVDEIVSLESEIEAAEKSILDLKDIVVCDGCGSKIEKEVAFCPNCGKEQEKEEPVEIKVEEEPEEVKEAEVVEVKEVEKEPKKAPAKKTTTKKTTTKKEDKK